MERCGGNSKYFGEGKEGIEGGVSERSMEIVLKTIRPERVS